MLFESWVFRVVVRHFDLWVLLSVLKWSKNYCASCWYVHFEWMSSFIVTLLIDFKPFSMAVVQSLMPSESLLVRFNDNEQIRPPVSSNHVVGVRIIRVEVENINKFSSFVNYNFIRFILHCHILMLLYKRSKNAFSFDHGSIPFTKLPKSQTLVV